jgi:hypothetical protein
MRPLVGGDLRDGHVEHHIRRPPHLEGEVDGGLRQRVL